MEQLGVDEAARLKAISICRRHFRPTPRCDMAVSIRLSNRFSPRNHFHPPVLICCQIMFTSVIPARAHRARDSGVRLISAAPVWDARYCAPGLSAHVTGHNLLLFRRKLNLLSVVKRECAEASPALIAVKVARRPYCSRLVDWMHPGSRSLIVLRAVSSIRRRQIEFCNTARRHAQPDT